MATGYNQLHYEIVKITIPSVTGACTVGDSDGYGTPLTCDQATNAETTYNFCSDSAPLLPGVHYRYLKSISETVTKLEPGKGLANRGSGTITLIDFNGDPNKTSPALINEPIIAAQGSFLGKLAARNILANKKIVIELHSIINGVDNFPTPVQTREYIIESLQNNGNGTYALRFKDVMSTINFDEYQFPSNEEGFLRQDIDDTTTSIPVDSDPYAIGDVILVSDEFMKVTGVSGIGGGSALLTVQTRGQNISFSQTLTRTEKDEHSAGDSVFNCTVSDNERIDDFIEALLLDSGIDATIIANSKPQWTEEVNEWHPNTKLNTLWYKKENGNDVLKSLLTDLLMDIWHDPTSNLIKISAISEWKKSNSKVQDGRQITSFTFKYTIDDTIRATQAISVYDKKFLARSDDRENYARVSTFTDPILEGPDYYGKRKVKRFENSRILDADSSALLTQRFISRFGLGALKESWKVEERFLDFELGSVVDIDTPQLQGANGLPSTNARAQILSIQPKYGGVGREWTVSAMTYSPEFSASDIIYRNFDTMLDINLFNEAGQPNLAVNLTFVFDNVKIGSRSQNTPSMRAGNFVAGSTLTVIYVNGTDHQSRGGRGGRGGSTMLDGESNTWIQTVLATSAGNGSNCYDDDGIATQIFLSGATGNGEYPNADGYIRAPGGGGGATNSFISTAGDGGGGGAGFEVGLGGAGGASISNQAAPETGNPGNPGTDAGTGGLSTGIGGNGGNWGINGTSAATAGGNKGKGLAGIVTTITGATAARFINGGGEPSL